MRVLRLATLVLALALVSASAAPAAKPKPKTPFPVVESIAPRALEVGETLTLRGRNFLPGFRRNTVVFRHGKGRLLFVKAGRSTRTRLRVVLPSRLQSFLPVRDGKPGGGRFRMRVLARRFGARFTSPSRSPYVRPVPPGAGPGGGDTGCNTSAPLGDADSDGFDNTLEKQAATDPCRADTDGDLVPDGYEYLSALDYNDERYDPYSTHPEALPYPAKRPYPNPLDPRDGQLQIDHDGDGLTLVDEFLGWKRFAGSRRVRDFSSAGSQASGGYRDAGGSALDSNGDGQLTDDEKDYDGDALGNWDEAHGRMTPEWWTAKYAKEPKEIPYGLSEYKQTNWLDADTDGDRLEDGTDDVDHDKRSNFFELDRIRAAQWTNPFNPCLPEYRSPGPGVPNGSPTCSRYIPFENAWMPWGEDGLLPSGAGPPYPWPPPPGSVYYP